MLNLRYTGCRLWMVIGVMLLICTHQVHANPRYASIVINADTGIILHESRADASRYPASLTKMMTLYMLFETIEQGSMKLDSRMSVSTHAAAMPQTNIGLQAGETIKVRDAIEALIVRSANDVAAVVAEALGDTEANFGRMMTDKARKLGMRATIFRNASGLPNREQKTTARDMALLSARLMKDFPDYYHFFSTQSFRYKGTTYRSHNRMVRTAPGVDGLKTGYIRASGFNVATSAKRNNTRIIAVVMGGKTAASRDRHMAQLLKRGFEQMRTIKVAGNTRPISSIFIKPPVPAAKPVALVSSQPDPSAILQGDFSSVSMAQSAEMLPNSDSWAVQIGSYQEPDRAEAQAQAATRWVTGEIAVVAVEISNQTLYRARLIGLQKNQAQTACQSLSRQGIECMVVRLHSLSS